MSPASEQQKNGEPMPDQSLLGGREYYAIDAKRRFAIPAGMRKIVGARGYVYVMPDLHEPCLCLFSPTDMEGRVEKLRSKPLHDKKASRALRALGENLEKVTIDVQGRIRICDRLLKFATLEDKDKVAIVGKLHHVQLWSPVLLPEEEPVNQGELAEVFADVDF